MDLCFQACNCYFISLSLCEMFPLPAKVSLWAFEPIFCERSCLGPYPLFFFVLSFIFKPFLEIFSLTLDFHGGSNHWRWSVEVEIPVENSNEKSINMSSCLVGQFHTSRIIKTQLGGHYKGLLSQNSNLACSSLDFAIIATSKKLKKAVYGVSTSTY